MTLNEYKEAPDVKHLESKTIEGISTFVKPITDAEDSQKYFGLNLLEKGIIPIYLSIKNSNQNKFYTINSNSIIIGNTEQIDQSVNPAQDKRRESEKLASAGAIGGMFFLLPAAALASESSVIKENLDSKRFRSQTIEPGEKASGFCYFKLDELKTSEQLGLYIELKENLDFRTIPLLLPVNLTR